MECFICADTTQPLFRVCACNTLVHEECFKKLVNVPSHATHCAICRKQYKMDVTLAKKIDCHRLNCSFTSILIALLVLDVVGLCLSNITVMTLILSSLAFSILSMLGILFYRNRMETQQWCCIWIKARPIHRLLYLPDPECPTLHF